MASHHLHGGHINLIEVRSFFSIDFDVDEVVVHQLRDLFVLERLVFHHMTPVTRRITDAQQNRLVISFRLAERRFSPRMPIDGIVRVLEQVRTGLVNQRVCVFVIHRSFLVASISCVRL